MNRSNTLVLAGLVLAVVSAFAEPLGLGNANGFGPRQWVGTITGVLILVVGLAMRAKATKAA